MYLHDGQKFVRVSALLTFAIPLLVRKPQRVLGLIINLQNSLFPAPTCIDFQSETFSSSYRDKHTAITQGMSPNGFKSNTA